LAESAFPLPSAMLGVMNSKLLRSYFSLNSFIAAEINPDGLNVNDLQFHWRLMNSHGGNPKRVEYHWYKIHIYGLDYKQPNLNSLGPKR
jgi:hypothetical protein